MVFDQGDIRASQGPSRAASTPRRVLRGRRPLRDRAFVGRAADLEQLERLVREGAPLVTITGAAGIGKSALAARFIAASDERSGHDGGRAILCDLSEAHVGRLASAIDRLDRYLDPVIAVPAGGGKYWSPNGFHRLSAMKQLGARAITALVVPEPEVAHRIWKSTGGNPLALLEARRQLGDDQLSGREPLPEPLPAGPALESAFAARAASLPDESRRALIESKRSEWELRNKQTDAFAATSYPEGAQLCSKCNTAAVVMMDGCMTCLSCGESKCG